MAKNQYSSKTFKNVSKLLSISLEKLINPSEKNVV